MSVVTKLQLKGFDARWRHVSWSCLHVFLHGMFFLFFAEVHAPGNPPGSGSLPNPPPPPPVTYLKTSCTFVLFFQDFKC